MAEASPVSTGTAAETVSDRARGVSLRWFGELQDPLRRYLVCSGVRPADADEAVQESFLRLYRHLEKGREVDNVRAWVFQVARNYLKDERKSAHSRHSVPLDNAMEREGRFADPGANPEHGALHEERARRLTQAIERLPAQQRECILLRSSGLRYREIAEVMGININNVGGLVMRAVARLSEELA